MSFGFSVGDFIVLTQLASNVVQGARKACGAHDELTREVTSLHIVLRQLEREVAKPQSILNSGDDDRKQELKTLAEHCEKSLNVLSNILEKYNGLSEEKRRVTKFWKKVQFGNGEMQDLSKIRLELSTHTNVITLFLNLLSVGSLGKVEEQMTSHGEELRAMRHSVNWVTASLQVTAGREGSILSDYKDDDKAFWRELRRGLVKEGYTSRVLRKHKKTVTDYVKELGDRGALDELPEYQGEDTENGASEMRPEDPNCEETPLEASAKEDEEPTPSHASMETPTTATHENNWLASIDNTVETPMIAVPVETEEVRPIPTFVVLEERAEETSPAEQAEEMKTSNTTFLGLNNRQDDVRKSQDFIRTAEDESEREAPRYRGNRLHQEMLEEWRHWDRRGEKSEIVQEKEKLWRDEPRLEELTPELKPEELTPEELTPEELTLEELMPEELGEEESGRETLRQQKLGQDKFKQDESWQEIPRNRERFRMREELRREEPKGEELGRDRQKEEKGHCDERDRFEPAKPTSPAPTKIPSSKTRFPRAVFVPNPDGSWQRVSRHSDDKNSRYSEATDESRKHGPKKPVSVEDVGDEYFPSWEYPIHEDDNGVFWEPPCTEISLDFVVHHLEARDDDPLDEREEIFHNGDIFVVPRRGDSPYMGFHSPKFAYNLGGARIPVTGRPGHLVVQSPNLALIAPHAPNSSLPQMPLRTCPPPAFMSAKLVGDRAEDYARAYISAACGKLPPAPPPYLLQNQATQADARKQRLPSKSLLELWNPAQEPIIILGTVFDTFSLGHWIYKWTIFHHGASTPVADMAAELWILCIQWCASVKASEEGLQHVRNEKTREMVEDFVESGERLMDKLKALVSACEGPMKKQTKIVQSGGIRVLTLGNEAGFAFVDTIFGHHEQLEATEKWMASVRLWSFRFNVNCSSILANPRNHRRYESEW